MIDRKSDIRERALKMKIKKCEHCRENFKKKDEVVITDGELLHTDCLYEYLLGGSMQTYYDSYEDYLLEDD